MHYEDSVKKWKPTVNMLKMERSSYIVKYVEVLNFVKVTPKQDSKHSSPKKTKKISREVKKFLT